MSENTPHTSTTNEPASSTSDRAAETATTTEFGAPSTSGLSEEDLKTTRAAAIGAIVLTSRAEKGFIDQFKEVIAASKAVQAAPSQVHHLLVGGAPSLPNGEASQFESDILGLISQAAQLISAKAPELMDAYRQAVLTTAHDVADAAGGISQNEQLVIDKIRAAFAA